jgi:hypothetical protein
MPRRISFVQVPQSGGAEPRAEPTRRRRIGVAAAARQLRSGKRLGVAETGETPGEDGDHAVLDLGGDVQQTQVGAVPFEA